MWQLETAHLQPGLESFWFQSLEISVIVPRHGDGWAACKQLPEPSCGFSSSHVQMWELDHKGGWVPKNWCFWIVELEKTFESPLDRKEIKSVNPKGNQPWIVIGRTDSEAEAPIHQPSDVKSWLMENTLMLEKTEDKRRMGQQRMRCWMASSTQWRWVWANSRR